MVSAMSAVFNPKISSANFMKKKILRHFDYLLTKFAKQNAPSVQDLVPVLLKPALIILNVFSGFLFIKHFCEFISLLFYIKMCLFLIDCFLENKKFSN